MLRYHSLPSLRADDAMVELQIPFAPANHTKAAEVIKKGSGITFSFKAKQMRAGKMAQQWVKKSIYHHTCGRREPTSEVVF